MKPLLILNFKSFSSSTCTNAVRLAEICEKFAQRNKNFQLGICASALDVISVSRVVNKCWLFSQHVDPCFEGAFTGSICISTVKPFCCGTLLNHAEKKISFPVLEKTVSLCKENNLKTLVCADSLKEAVRVAGLAPDFLALEPPDLIGSGISVSTARPQLVTDFIKAIKKANKKQVVLVGAGITNAADVTKSFELGARGVLVASAFAKNKNPAKWLGSIQQLRLLQ